MEEHQSEQRKFRANGKNPHNTKKKLEEIVRMKNITCVRSCMKAKQLFRFSIHECMLNVWFSVRPFIRFQQFQAMYIFSREKIHIRYIFYIWHWTFNTYMGTALNNINSTSATQSNQRILFSFLCEWITARLSENNWHPSSAHHYIFTIWKIHCVIRFHTVDSSQHSVQSIRRFRIAPIYFTYFSRVVNIYIIIILLNPLKIQKNKTKNKWHKSMMYRLVRVHCTFVCIHNKKTERHATHNGRKKWKKNNSDDSIRQMINQWLYHCPFAFFHSVSICFASKRQ